MEANIKNLNQQINLTHPLMLFLPLSSDIVATLVYIRNRHIVIIPKQQQKRLEDKNVTTVRSKHFAVYQVSFNC